MASLVLRIARLSLYLVGTLLLMPVQALALAVSPRGIGEWIPRTYHRFATVVLGLRIQTSGGPSDRRPTLFVVNHISYLDIEVLSTVLPASFVAKAEIARWPFFGWLAKLQRTVFIDRKARSLSAQRDSISRRLLARDNLILFPEGTSGDGNRVLPFKSALLSIADLEVDGAQIAVQPVSIAYTRCNGIPIGRDWRAYFAWYGDMELVSHLWTMVGLGRVSVMVQFHPPVQLAQFSSRKALADHCRQTISQGVSDANAGRRPVASDPVPVPLPSPEPVRALAAHAS